MSRTSLDAPASSPAPEEAAGARAAGAGDERVDGADGSAASADDADDADAADTDGAAGAGGSDDTADGAGGSDDAADDAAAADDGKRRFGEQPAKRFAADVEYRGRAGEHDYVVRVRHRLLDTTFTVEIDGIEHDPKAEQKARRSREKAGELDEAGAEDPSEAAALQGVAEPGSDADDAEQADGPEDGEVALQFGLEDGFSTLRCTVRRRREGGEIKDCEVITIRTAGLGGAGEVEVRHGFRTTVLVPEKGSPSALRDEKRTAHPARYALMAAVAKAARFLIPLLGLGALFGGILDPVEEWVEKRIRPAVDAIAQATQPIRDWVGEVTRPVREFLDALLSPVRELIAAILRPIGDALRWLLDLLPDIGLPFSVPEWLVDVLVPVIVVVVVFMVTYRALRTRREKLADTREGKDAAAANDAGAAGGASARRANGADSETARGADAEAANDADAEAGRGAGADGDDYGTGTPEPSPRDAR